MKKRTFYLVVVFMLIAGSLTGCFRPASNAPKATPTVGDFPLPGTTAVQTMGVFETIGTQTEAARQSAAAGTPVAPEQGATQPPATSPETAPSTDVVPPATSGQTNQPSQPTGPTYNPADIPDIEVPTSYTLEKGEFPYCIARRFDLSPANLLAANGLNAYSVVQAGSTLSIPTSGGDFPGERSLHNHPTTYNVRAGDSIYIIACYFGDVSPEQIIAANGLSSPYTVSAGQTLQIP